MQNKNTHFSRRRFLAGSLTGLAISPLLVPATSLGNDRQEDERLHVAVSQWSCIHLYRRDKIDFWTRLDELKRIGFDGMETMISPTTDVESFGKRLADHGLTMRACNTGGNLYEEESAENEIVRILTLGERVKPFGTSIIILTPRHPKERPSGKTDAELTCQSRNFNILGAGLRKIGISLAFHHHTEEFAFAGREFHHVLCGTDPGNVALCFEQHWSYRGCGHSQVAMFDHLKLYGHRCVVAHLRQSVGNVWSETFGDGDIDNVRLAAELKKMPTMPHLVLEQAPEEGTPKTLTAAEVLRQSVEYVRKIFG